MNWPRGAIETVGEVYDLIKAATDGSHTTIFIVFDGSLRDIILDKDTFLTDNNNSIRNKRFDTGWNISPIDFVNHRHPRYPQFLFRNYWDAYAYHLKQKAKEKEQDYAVR